MFDEILEGEQNDIVRIVLNNLLRLDREHQQMVVDKLLQVKYEKENKADNQWLIDMELEESNFNNWWNEQRNIPKTNDNKVIALRSWIIRAGF